MVHFNDVLEVAASKFIRLFVFRGTGKVFNRDVFLLTVLAHFITWEMMH